jgi:hypothetical protein
MVERKRGEKSNAFMSIFSSRATWLVTPPMRPDAGFVEIPDPDRASGHL